MFSGNKRYYTDLLNFELYYTKFKVGEGEYNLINSISETLLANQIVSSKFEQFYTT
jgi:hypothetical protein